MNIYLCVGLLQLIDDFLEEKYKKAESKSCRRGYTDEEKYFSHLCDCCEELLDYFQDNMIIKVGDA